MVGAGLALESSAITTTPGLMIFAETTGISQDATD